jgi:hypothetical protein
MKKVLRLYDQGDVLVIAGGPIALEGKDIPADKERTILAYGEVTGHAHALPADMVARFVVNEQAQRALELKGPAFLRHEEHRAFELPVGEPLQIDGQEEYVPGALPRAVVD